MLNLQSFKEAAQQIKDKLTKSPLEQTLSEATSNENWNTPTKLLQEIAEATYGYTSCDTVIKFIWKRLDSDNREWRRILKTLNMIEYLVKNGAPRCVGEFRDNIFKIRSFSDFFLVESGSDKGLSIRDKTKQLVDLLSNEKLIEEERENAKKIRERLAAAGGVGAIGSNTSYQGYSSDSYKNNNESNYKGYGSNDTYKGYGNDSTNKLDQTYQQKYGTWESGGGLDKYKKSEGASANNNNTQTTNTANNITWPAPQQAAPPQQAPAPFTEPIQRLAKPGEKWDVPAPKPQQTQQTQQVQVQQTTQQKPNIIDIWDTEPQQQQVVQPQKVQPLQPPPQKQQSAQDWGSFEVAKTQTTTTSLLPDDIFGAPQQASFPTQPQFPTQQAQTTLPTQLTYPTQQTLPLTQQPQLISLTLNTQVQQQQVQQLYNTQQQQVQQPPLYNNQVQQISIQQPTLYNNQQQYQQNQLQYQQNNLQYLQQQQSYQQNQQQLLFNQQYSQPPAQQQNNNLYQQQYKPPTQQTQQKQDDFGFSDFVSAPKTNNNNNQGTDLLGMLDLKKEKAELEQKKQIPIAQPQQQLPLYASQMDMDQFQINYQRPPQYQYQQGR